MKWQEKGQNILWQHVPGVLAAVLLRWAEWTLQCSWPKHRQNTWKRHFWRGRVILLEALICQNLPAIFLQILTQICGNLEIMNANICGLWVGLRKFKQLIEFDMKSNFSISLRMGTLLCMISFLKMLYAIFQNKKYHYFLKGMN